MENKQKLFNIRLDVDLHKKLRYLSIDKDTSMQQFIIEAILEKLEKESE